MPKKGNNNSVDSSQVRDGSLLVEEMQLYYEEVRSVNQHSITCARAFGVVALTLLAYSLFGLRSAENDPFWKAVEARPDSIATAAKVYSVSGVIYCLLLFVFGVFCILQLGESRRHKLRYFRSISILRDKLHRYNSLILAGNSRAIPIQTGLELSPHKNYEGMVPRPVLTGLHYFVGNFLAISNAALFIVPLVYFVGILGFALCQFQGSVEAYLLMSFHALSPVTAVVILVTAKTMQHYYYSLRKAQYSSPENLEPVLHSEKEKGKTRVLLCVIRLALTLMGTASVFSTGSYFGGKSSISQDPKLFEPRFHMNIGIGEFQLSLSGTRIGDPTSYDSGRPFVLQSTAAVHRFYSPWITFLLIGGAIVERLLTASVRRRPGRATVFRILVLLTRAFGPGDIPEHVAKGLSLVIGSDRAKEWKAAYEKE